MFAHIGPLPLQQGEANKDWSSWQKPNATPGTWGPTPPPTPPNIKDATNCAMRSFFLEYAAKVNRNINAERAQQLKNALSGDPTMPPGCVVKVPPLPSKANSTRSLPVTSDLSTAIFSDAVSGNDISGDGTLSKPFKTVGRALAATRETGGRTGGTINLRSGTFFITAPLDLTAADSGLTIRTYPGDDAPAWLSGATPLVGITWNKQGAGAGATNIWSADLTGIEGLTDVMSLRIRGERGILARYPNCNPETELCMAPGKGPQGSTNTTTLANKWIVTNGTIRPKTYTAPNGTSRNFSCPSPSFSRGCDVEYTMRYGGGNCALLTPPISHWCTSDKSIAGAALNSTLAPHQPYAKIRRERDLARCTVVRGALSRTM
jgi:hypothetical protein